LSRVRVDANAGGRLNVCDQGFALIPKKMRNKKNGFSIANALQNGCI
jgi:hypothetical protein